jgi:hypothetical protein
MFLLLLICLLSYNLILTTIPVYGLHSSKPTSVELPENISSTKSDTSIGNAVIASSPLQFSGFIDTYYAYSFNEPSSGIRAYTTQPLYHNAIGINLAMATAKYNGSSVRGVLSLHMGSFVESNYGGADYAYRNIQEAYAGLHLGGSWWAEAGVFLSHIGFESLISRDNWSYTRSNIAEYTPYYESGLRIGGNITEQLTATFLVLNGWQNIIENNSNKALGTQIQFRPNSTTLLNWSTFYGNEQPDSMLSQHRFWNNFYIQTTLSNGIDAVIMADYGLQKSLEEKTSTAYSIASQLRFTLSPKFRTAIRGEWYSDKSNIIPRPTAPQGFEAGTISTTLDYLPSAQLIIRTELRYLHTPLPLFPKKSEFSTNEMLFVVSMGVTL